MTTEQTILNKSILSRSNNLPNEGDFLAYDLLILQDDYNLAIYDNIKKVEIEFPTSFLPHLIKMCVDKMERNSKNP